MYRECIESLLRRGSGIGDVSAVSSGVEGMILMGWKPTGEPTVRKQRDKWTVRVEGIDTETGKVRPRQIGTYPSQRAARATASKATASGDLPMARGTLAWLLDRWVASRTDVSAKSKLQYEWAAGHLKAGLGQLPLDKLDRDDVARWLEESAAAGKLSKRSLQICRMVLRAALADAVEEGLLRRSPAARVALPKVVVRVAAAKEVDAWDDAQVRAFLSAVADHRWGGPFQLAVLYGLRRSELLALRWSGIDLEGGTVTIAGGLVEVRGVPVWTEGKNARSRRKVVIDAETTRVLRAHRAVQLQERLLAGAEWVDLDLVVSSRTGTPVSPGSSIRPWSDWLCVRVCLD